MKPWLAAMATSAAGDASLHIYGELSVNHVDHRSCRRARPLQSAALLYSQHDPSLIIPEFAKVEHTVNIGALPSKNSLTRLSNAARSLPSRTATRGPYACSTTTSARLIRRGS